MDTTQAQLVTLLGISQINEDIKRVVKTSYAISLSSLNAMLLAHKAGKSAIGFGIVSGELRSFSSKLEHVMGELSAIIDGTVNTVADLLKQRKLNAYLEACSRNSESSKGHLEPAFQRKLRQIEADRQTFLERRHKMIRLLDDASKLCRMGSVSARAAKIEAAYSQRFSAELQQVSDQAERTVGDIVVIIKQLQTHLK